MVDTRSSSCVEGTHFQIWPLHSKETVLCAMRGAAHWDVSWKVWSMEEL